MNPMSILYWCFGTHDRIRICFRGMVWVLMFSLIVWQGWLISSKQKQVRAANERNYRLVQGLPAPVVMCDDKQRIVEFNKEAESVFGWKSAEVIGKSVDVLIVPDERKMHSDAFNKALAVLERSQDDWAVTRTNVSGTALRKDGTQLPIYFNTRGVKYAGRIEFLATMRKEHSKPKTVQGPIDLKKP